MDPTSLALEFICPICNVLPYDPVLADDGFIYDKECIDEHIRRNNSETLKSPMTGEPMREIVIPSDTVKQTIRELTACDELENAIRGRWGANTDESKSFGDKLSDAKAKAKKGDTDEMVKLSEWYLFGQADMGVERDEIEGFKWCKLAADQDDICGKAYEGYCLICGKGIESDWEDGYELLVEAASQDSNDIARGEQQSCVVMIGYSLPYFLRTAKSLV